METQLARFLFRYRLTPHSTTGIAPAELLMRRRPCSRLDLLHPNMAERVREQQLRQKVGHDKHCRQRSFSEGELVWLKNQGIGPPWLPGTITRMISPECLMAELGDGRTLERHIDHCRPRILSPNTDREPTVILPNPTIVDDSVNEQTDQQPAIEPEPAPAPRRSTRDRHPPDRLM